MQLKMEREGKREKYKISLIYRQCIGATDYLQNKTKFDKIGSKVLNKEHSKGLIHSYH